MSTNYMVLEDSILNIITSIQAERDPIERLRAIRKLEAASTKEFRKIKREAAYEARMKHSSGHIAESLGMDRKDIDYLVRVYRVDNPYLPAPPHRPKYSVPGVLDLSRE